MIVKGIEDVVNQKRVVTCPNGGFKSFRYLIEKDNMGFGMTKTVIPPNGEQYWHYKNHLEACFCVEGKGEITNVSTGEKCL